MKKLFFAVIMLALACSPLADAQAKSKKKSHAGKQTAMQVASQMWPGWNLGNTMEGGTYDHEWTDKAGVDSEVSWQKTRTTRQLFAFVRQQGFRSVRIPCAWAMGHVSGPDECEVDTAWLNRVQQLVDWCLAEDLYVIINQHWDGGWLEHDGVTDSADVATKQKQMASIWRQIAQRFRNYDQRLLFAGMNEPAVGGASPAGKGNLLKDQELSDRIALYEQTFIDAVRATGGRNKDRILVVQGPNTNIDITCQFDYFPRLKDTVAERLMMEVHYYDPYQFSGMQEDADWGKMWYYWGSNNKGEAQRNTVESQNECHVVEQMEKLRKLYVSKGVPVVLGEYAAQQRWAVGKDPIHDASIRDYYRVVTRECVNHGVLPFVWDTNYHPGMSIIDREALKVVNTNMMTGIQKASAEAVWPTNERSVKK